MKLPSLAEIDAELARRRLLNFTLWTMPGYQVNWHHEVVCGYLDRFVAGEIKRLMIFQPPRTGKSELVSRRLPAFILGQNPDATIIATSYGADLARRMNRDVQRIMDSEPYMTLFPDSLLYGKNVRSTARGSWLRNSDMFEVVGHAGYYMGTGVGGAITGMGAHVVIIDDPVKNRKEANSAAYQKGVFDWYTSTLYTRLAPDGQVLVTLTRWHELDLAGQLLKLAASDSDADQWEIVCLPALAESPVAPYDHRQVGDALWPSRWPPAKLRTIRRTVGSRDWASLYQQRPAPDEGNIFKRQWWRFWQPRGAHLPPVLVTVDEKVIEIEPEELPLQFDEMLQSWDLTFKSTDSSDFVAGQVWGRHGANKYLMDYVLDRLDVIGAMKEIGRLTGKWPSATAKLIEDKANGPAVITMLKGKLAGLIPVEPEGGKVSRAYAAQPEVEAGNVFLPHPAMYGWVDGFIGSCAAFPNAANDDDVDAFTQAIIRWQGVTTVTTAAAKVTTARQVEDLFG